MIHCPHHNGCFADDADVLIVTGSGRNAATGGKQVGIDGDLRFMTALDEMDVDWIHDEISTRSYWAPGRTRAQTMTILENSVVYGFARAGRQIAFARVVTDFVTFGYLADVWIAEAERGQGVGTRLLEAIHSDPRLAGLKRMILFTRDAQPFYGRLGWSSVEEPERIMVREPFVAGATPDAAGHAGAAPTTATTAGE